MDGTKCPKCDARITPAEVADGWCEACGAKLPLYVLAAARAAARARAAPQARSAEPVRRAPAGRGHEDASTVQLVILFIYYISALLVLAGFISSVSAYVVLERPDSLLARAGMVSLIGGGVVLSYSMPVASYWEGVWRAAGGVYRYRLLTYVGGELLETHSGDYELRGRWLAYHGWLFKGPLFSFLLGQAAAVGLACLALATGPPDPGAFLASLFAWSLGLAVGNLLLVQWPARYAASLVRWHCGTRAGELAACARCGKVLPRDAIGPGTLGRCASCRPGQGGRRVSGSP